MNETGVDLPPLPDGWIWTTIEKVIQIIDYRGRTPPYSLEGIPHLRSANVKKGNIIWSNLKYVTEDTYNKYMTRGLPKQGDLLFTTEAPLGEVAFAPSKKFSLAQRIMILRPFEDVIKPEFLLYQIQTGSFQERLRISETGSVVKGISSRNFKPFPIIIPPLPEQYRIVAKIEELFTKLDVGINELHKAQSQLKRYRQSVLKAAFEGKLTEAWRAKHQDEIEPPTIIEGDLPDGWTWVTVGKIAQKIHYGYTESATDDPIGPKFLRITDIQNSSVNWDSVPYCQIDEIKQQQYLLKENDLVFARTGATVGKSFLIQGSIPDAVFASYLIRIVLEKEINAKFVYTFFQSQSYWMQIHQGKVGSGQPNVNAKILSQITLPLPPLPEQQAIVSEVESRLSVADEVEKTVTAELKRAEQLRQSILKKAFSGKLVPQDPNDESASVLLEQIKAEESQHIQEQLRLKLV